MNEQSAVERKQGGRRVFRRGSHKTSTRRSRPCRRQWRRRRFSRGRGVLRGRGRWTTTSRKVCRCYKWVFITPQHSRGNPRAAAAGRTSCFDKRDKPRDFDQACRTRAGWFASERWFSSRLRQGAIQSAAEIPESTFGICLATGPVRGGRGSCCCQASRRSCIRAELGLAPGLQRGGFGESFMLGRLRTLLSPTDLLRPRSTQRSAPHSRKGRRLSRRSSPLPSGRVARIRW